MPELPEVETVCQGLRDTILEKTIAKIKINRPNLRYPLDHQALSTFHNHKITAVTRRSKYIILHFDRHQDVILIHLGMSGRIHNYADTTVDKVKHTHVEFDFKDSTAIHFIDPRRFGFVHVIKSTNLNDYWHGKRLGIEPLNDELTATYLHQALQVKKISLKAALLDQSIIAGLGNIYVCEALHLSKLSPYKITNTVTLEQCDTLIHFIKIVLRKAIQAGGSTLRDHKKVNGDTGYFQFDFHVYNQESKLCRLCEVEKIIRVKQNGRSTFYCTACQLVS